MTKERFYVYAYFRRDGSPAYVGKGSNGRWKAHLKGSENRRLRLLISQSGKELPHLILRSGLSHIEAIEIEKSLIAAIGRGSKGPLVNMTDGGDGGMLGYNFSDISKEKNRRSHLGKRHTDDAKAKVSVANIGKITSVETRLKMSMNNWQKGKPLSREQKAAISAAQTGRKHPPRSIEYRASLSAAMKGKKKSPEHIAKLRVANLGKKASAETRAKMTTTRLGQKRGPYKKKS